MLSPRKFPSTKMTKTPKGIRMVVTVEIDRCRWKAGVQESRLVMLSSCQWMSNIAALGVDDAVRSAPDRQPSTFLAKAAQTSGRTKKPRGTLTKGAESLVYKRLLRFVVWRHGG